MESDYLLTSLLRCVTVIQLFGSVSSASDIAMLVAPVLQALPHATLLSSNLVWLTGATLLCREVAICLCRIRFVRSVEQRRAFRRLAMVMGSGAFIAASGELSPGQSLAVAVTAAWFVVLMSMQKATRRRS